MFDYEAMLANAAAGTPGPFSIDPPSEQTPHLWIIAGGNSGVSKIETCDYDDGQGERLTDEDRANARRVASIPDMEAEITRLRTVQAELVEALRAFDPRAIGSGQSTDMRALHAAQMAARAALEKAGVR